MTGGYGPLSAFQPHHAGHTMIGLLSNRRSIRKFTPQAVSEQHIEKLLAAGLLAPSSKDTRPVELVAVRDRTVIKALAACRDSGTMPLNTASLVVAVTANTGKADVWVENASIAAILVQLEAEKLGLGSTWVQMRLRTNSGKSAEDEVRKTLGIPANYGVLCLLAIGHKDEIKRPRQLDEADWARTHSEHF